MDWIEIATKAIPGIIVAIIASIMGVSLAFRRANKEKWWASKHETYTEILNTLHQSKRYAEKHYDAQMSRKFMSEEEKEELKAEWKIFSRKLDQLTDLASFRLSSESVEILQSYKTEKQKAMDLDMLEDIIEADLEATIKCLSKIKASAKKDLGVK